MISSLDGIVEAVNASGAVINVGGVGFHVIATANTLAGLHVGQTGRVLTYLLVREDALTLFGFSSDDERSVFEALIGVSGIGARTALAILAVHSPDDLRGAVAAKNEAALTQVPGIGKKSAQRILLELDGKLGAPTVAASAHTGPSVIQAPDVLEALVNLGWQEKPASVALDEAIEAHPQASVPELLRAALQILGSNR
ncbi:MAG: Holliday junction branch migration protein RuvA [Actinomycetaceae bacterium]|nr:Holliday junction branch migration protein RuvA [Arcanobacterium sp.]MDD7505241.1 Holliday junction branch migration protein RuvA [Actinomycetaceae bacterium]